MADQSILRITRELRDIQRGSDLSIAVACKDSNVRHIRALIIGPPDTPYEFGFFEFSVKFGREYPTKSPAVNSLTTNGGRTRFNPNIYAGGKVCLSILGTWRGERGEEWSSAQGLESILISIQSLMSGNPYENEPGFENSNTDYDKKNQQAYVAKIRHETLRVSVIERLEGYLGINKYNGSYVMPYTPDVETDNRGDMGFEAAFEPFKDKVKRLFLWYYDSYVKAIDEESKKHSDGSRFEKMPFEGTGNTMEGTFQYTDLMTRLTVIRMRLMQESDGWVTEGKIAASKESSLANNLQRQFEQTVELFKKNDAIALDLELVDSNPFLWQLVLFGRPMTNLDGGMFRVKIYISPQFPSELPRVKVETPIFHHRVSKDGQLCFLVQKPDELCSYVEAIVAAIEDENPAYDPRTLVNLEASRLFWGSVEDRKVYSRKLRRSAQDSSEF
ncbi:UBC-like protein [Eremomyces bilateralis CBS 781.70]|uniref:Ubiquitin-conjugating enzyme E2 Z n=1 Tax=Eremomyces bilateralis CBS 781.70 TaxID=1392243 RepID=A0A6G1FSV9_9PEZI|nr:UBC-like protein [Eremomyces bilateralis CBS 781.70]KAF1808955.1 UBC-like protein [Eremomyces bilateralis CBS 781.70]